MNDLPDLDENTDAGAGASPTGRTDEPDLAAVTIVLLKGVIYREDDEHLWRDLLKLQIRVRNYISVMNLELLLDESEGYAFLKSREVQETDESNKLPRLVARRQLSFPVSLLLALLRKKLAEFDAGGEDTRLILSRDDIVEMIRIFLPESSNEVRLVDQIDNHIGKVVDLGFLRRLKVSGSVPMLEVRRILKAFVDAQWLAEFDAKLASYSQHLHQQWPDTKSTEEANDD